MPELSPEQTSKVLAKAQATVKRREEELAAAQDQAMRKDEKVAVEESKVRITIAQLGDTENGLASIDSKVRSTDPNDADAIRWLANERSILETRRLALEGRQHREQAELQQAQADASAAHVTVRALEEAVQKAKDHVASCAYDDQEARTVAAGEPLSKFLAERREFRERMEAEEHLRKVRNTWELAQGEWDSVVRPTLSRERHDHELQLIFDRLWAEKYGGGKPPSTEPSSEELYLAEQRALRERLEKEEPPDTNNPIKWKHRASPSHMPPSRVSVEKVRGGTEAQWDPFAEE
jgi:hypothetical protein